GVTPERHPKWVRFFPHGQLEIRNSLYSQANRKNDKWVRLVIFISEVLTTDEHGGGEISPKKSRIEPRTRTAAVLKASRSTFEPAAAVLRHSRGPIPAES